MAGDRAHERRRGSGLAVFAGSGTLLALCILLGGASRLNAAQLTILELCSLPLLGWAMWRITLEGLWSSLKAPAAILVGLLLVAAIQLMPLPPQVWSQLPAHAAAADALQLAGVDIGWRPLSLTPDLTVTALLALLPAVGLFLAIVLLRPSQQAWLAALVVLLGLVSLAIGGMQTLAGSDSGLFFYPFSNRDSPVGLFANRNHQASLMVCLLPLAAIAASVARARGAPGRLLWVALAMTFLLVIPFVIFLKSRAGVLLLGPSLLASLVILWPPKALLAPENRRAVLISAAVVGIAMAVGAVFGAGPLLERFSTMGEGRLLSAPVGVRAAWESMPLGSGLGSFFGVYAGVEPLNIMAVSYWQHAHNDYLELWMEAGVPAVLLILAFIAWWGWASLSAWRAPMEDAPVLARGGSVVIGMLLLHSFVDYPLRSPAMAAVLALACALLAGAGRASRRRRG